MLNFHSIAKLLALIGLASTLAACQPDSGALPDPSAQEQDAETLVKRNLTEVARSLASMMKDPEVRTLIYDKALEQWDGDYDVLYAHIANQPLSTGESFEQRLAAGITASEECRPKTFDIIHSIPNLQISVPVNIELWNPADFTPSVVANPGEGAGETVYGFNSERQIVAFKTKEDPTVPVVVVGIAERVDDAGNLRPEFLPTTGTTPAPSSQRVNGEAERLGSLQLKDLSWWEEWYNGEPEVRVRVIAFAGSFVTEVKAAELTNHFYTPSRNEVKDNKWWTVPLNENFLFYWALEPTTTTTLTLSDVIKMTFFEEDNGQTVTRTITAPGIGVEVKDPYGAVTLKFALTPNTTTTIVQTDKDEDPGDRLVYFSDPKSFTYSTGSKCSFKMK